MLDIIWSNFWITLICQIFTNKFLTKTLNIKKKCELFFNENWSLKKRKFNLKKYSYAIKALKCARKMLKIDDVFLFVVVKNH